MAAYNNRTGKTESIFDRKTNPFEDDYEDDFERVDREDIQRQIQQAQDRSLESTMRSLALIEDSHDMAIKTAEELQCQGEQLYRIERNLGDIQNNLSQSERHVRSMKSVWGAMANYFRKPPKPVPPPTNLKEDTSLGRRKASDLLSDPSMRFRASNRGPDEFGYGGSGAGSDGAGRKANVAVYSSSDPREKQLSANLDLLSRGIGQLKEGALTLGDEIERQNDHLDRIQGAADVTYDKLEKQEKDVRRLLRK